jgi:hypothetical protein
VFVTYAWRMDPHHVDGSVHWTRLPFADYDGLTGNLQRSVGSEPRSGTGVPKHNHTNVLTLLETRKWGGHKEQSTLDPDDIRP